MENGKRNGSILFGVMLGMLCAEVASAAPQPWAAAGAVFTVLCIMIAVDSMILNARDHICDKIEKMRK
ncbi:MAG: hypothetical protein HYT12_03755 [Candidatus Liptonbacteria bacterium]|nr:hypothetical protein [Candidatus Liptonbacteria bacterium]